MRQSRVPSLPDRLERDPRRAALRGHGHRRMRPVPVARQCLPARGRLDVRGPATAPQPAFDARILDGHVEIRLRRADRDERVPNDREAERQRVGTGGGTTHGHSN
ncbi:predicted protein [Streptomyces viridosporus ATCC 14672]|uniref:Predicted protein n=1 Tax=Streptomyces viridosporus (strain ATCC 14672 / DSM 40746 / JCM 4963 / KCTC 9882 / NRRL B-12104 / FH 1290) TaxID=566461 RepID=D5ZRU0_STRV1|nr:predicted protein [Streptomyces viridosporus ATCC 14672]